MKTKTLITATTFLGALLASQAASAYPAYTSATVNLRAGPGVEYPIVASVYEDQPVNVNGCLDQYVWCDIQAGPYRGWVSGEYLESQYGNQWQYIPQVGVEVGLPIIGFELDNYWDDYYRDRPFYVERTHYRTVYHHSQYYNHNNVVVRRGNNNDWNHNNDHHDNDHHDDHHDNNNHNNITVQHNTVVAPTAITRTTVQEHHDINPRESNGRGNSHHDSALSRHDNTPHESHDAPRASEHHDAAPQSHDDRSQAGKEPDKDYRKH